MRIPCTILLTSLFLLSAACDGKSPEPGAAKVAPASSAPTDKADGGAKAGTDQEGAAAKSAAVKPSDAAPAIGNPDLTDPSKATATAPDNYKVKFETTKGDFVVEVHRDWAPLGADRFYNLVKIGFFDDVAFFRAISGFMVQFGLHGEPAVTQAWRNARIEDDPVTESNKAGYITFATSGPNSRTTQVFINFGDNANLDGMGFAPFGKVVEGMDVVNNIHTGYGEGAPRGRGPSQGTLQSRGNAYLKEQFPELDYIKKVSIMDAAAEGASKK